MKKMIRKERKKEAKRAVTKKSSLMMRNFRPLSPNRNIRARKKQRILMRKCSPDKRREKTKSNSLINKSPKSKKSRKRRAKRTRRKKTNLTTKMRKKLSKKSRLKLNRVNKRMKKGLRVPLMGNLWTSISRKPSSTC